MPENNLTKKKNGKLVNFYENNKFVLLSGLVAFIITQLIAFCYDLIPYGDMTILRMDLYHQYGPLFAELYDRLTSGESLVYSWNSGLGQTFLGNYFNYLSSPLTIIILIFGHKNITEAISALIFIKAILSACTFTYYLKASLNKHNAATAGFGVLYAFCGYFVAYYWNLMWIDAMALFPLIVLGIEKIIKKGKPTLYCVSLAVMIFANYYMAFMICIFSVLYFLTYYFANYPISKKFNDEETSDNFFVKVKNSLFVSSGVEFAIFSVVAALLAAITIIPVMSTLGLSSATSGSAPTGLVKYFSTFDFLANHLANTDPTIRSSGDNVLPNVYCGILTVMLVPLYLFSKKISIREKVSYVALLAVLYFSFSNNFLNFFWHGFHFPNDLPYRFSYMYSFILLIIAFKALINIKEYTGRQILASGFGLICFIIFVEKAKVTNIDDVSLYVSLACAVGYVAILYLFTNKKYQVSLVSILLLCAISSEIAISDTNNYSMNQSKTNYTSDYDAFTEMKDRLDDIDGGFYRMELTDLRTRMDPCWFDYNGVSTFSSMAYEKVANLQQDVGLYGNYINSYTYKPQTAIYNAMFALKYIVKNDSSELSPELYNEMYSVNDFTVMKNNYNLSVAFAADSELKNWDSSIYKNPFLAQNEMFRMASGVDNALSKMSIDDVSYNNISNIYDNELESGSMRFSKIMNGKSGSVTFEITPETDQNVYIYIDSSSVSSVGVSSLLYSKVVDTLDEPYVVDLGLRPAGETIYVDIAFSETEDSGNFNFFCYGLDQEKFEEGYNKLSKGNFNITQYNDTFLKGTLTADEDNIVYTSIPYDSNWNIYVDGQKLSGDDVFKISDALLGFNVSAGEHEIIMNYSSSSLIAGEFISIVTIVVATLIIIMKRRQILFFKKKRKDKWLMLENDGFTVTVEECFDVNSQPEGVTVEDEVLNTAEDAQNSAEIEFSQPDSEVNSTDSETPPQA